MERKASWRSVSWWKLVAALVVTALVTSGCGSTRSDRELAAAAARSSGNLSPLPESEAATTPGASVESTSPVGTAETPASGGSVAAAPAVAAKTDTDRGGTASGATSQGSPTSPGSPRPNTTPGSGASSASGSVQAGPQPTPAPGASPSGPKPEIALGEIGTMSGLLGQGFIPTVDAARAWAADVNARGGLNGHRVRLVTGDDGGDPARALALARRMVEEDHVAAFYAESMVLTLHAILPYLEEKKVPMIGGCNCTPSAAHSPMVFQPGTGSDLGVAFGFALPLIAYTSERKVSIIYCREASACASGVEHVRKQVAPLTGLQIVHEAQASFAQPDFTAEVLAARNAGAAAIIVYMDNPSLLRIKRAAKRQGWEPLISTAWSSLDERFIKDGGPETEGVLVSSPLATWTSPRMADYLAAMSRYVPGGVRAGLGVTAWAGGKLIERVASVFPDGPVASSDFLRGLYSLKDETLGGIAAPMTFQPGQPKQEVTCVILTKVEGGRFVPKTGDNYFCPPVKN